MKKLFSLLVVSVLLFSACQKQEQIPVASTEPSTQEAQTNQKRSAQITQGIILPDQEKREETVSIIGEESALDLLKRTHTVTVKSYSFGDIAESIDGVAGGTDGRYWIFYVNGKQSDVGASAYKVKDGDTVIWKLQKENETL